MSRTGVLFLQSQSYFGADSYIHSLLMRDLDRSRFDVHVACTQGSPEFPSPTFRALSAIPELAVRPTNFGPSIFALSARGRFESAVAGAPVLLDFPRLVLYARRHHIRIVHGTEKPRDVLWAVALARLVGARSVVHLHIKYQEGMNLRTRSGIANSDAVIGVSDFVSRSAMAGGKPASQVFTVLNGLDHSEWVPRPGVRESIRAELGLGPCQPVALIASRLFHWKGHRELVEAFALVRERIPHAHLLVVGEDDPRANDGRSFRAEIEAQARCLGLRDAVTFTGFRSDVPALMQAADVFAMPSFEEPLGMVYLEAMAMGLPVVALESGGAPEVIHHGCSGLLSAPGDVRSLAENIATLLADPGLRHRMGENGRCRVLEHFTPGRLARDVEDVYGRILAGH